jgi:hypothetical protein
MELRTAGSMIGICSVARWIGLNNSSSAPAISATARCHSHTHQVTETPRHFSRSRELKRLHRNRHFFSPSLRLVL